MAAKPAAVGGRRCQRLLERLEGLMHDEESAPNSPSAVIR